MFGLQPLIPHPHLGGSMLYADHLTKGPKTLKDCHHNMTIPCLRELYSMTGYKPHGKPTRIGVAGFDAEYGNRADLQTFFKMYRPDFLGTSYNTVLVNGGLDNQTQPGIEANLDIQYVAGLTFPNSLTYYSVGGLPPFIPDDFEVKNANEPFLDFVCHLSEQENIPQTISISYGDDEQTIPKDYASRVCTEFAQLGARGTSVLVSSGDFGVGAGNCLTNDGRNATRFIPSFPATCPFVTTVGATNGTSPEVGADFSGGGFSEYFRQPCFQKTAVRRYLRGTGNTYAGLFNPKGRAFPDVSAQGSAFQVVVGGEVISVDGTSASTPVFAAIICLINDHRLAHGKKPLGFLNPLLYSRGKKALNDIVSGNNPGCGTTGFRATTGWDPITGLGTPNLDKLLAILG
ncbi:hypothetical protein BGX28_008580 [Mortierella sp. GBA30]|nr:hypothetical protein BGX28_008580 [Mortierella sp. GBA30]